MSYWLIGFIFGTADLEDAGLTISVDDWVRCAQLPDFPHGYNDAIRKWRQDHNRER